MIFSTGNLARSCPRRRTSTCPSHPTRRQVPLSVCVSCGFFPPWMHGTGDTFWQQHYFGKSLHLRCVFLPGPLLRGGRTGPTAEVLGRTCHTSKFLRQPKASHAGTEDALTSHRPSPSKPQPRPVARFIANPQGSPDGACSGMHWSPLVAPRPCPRPGIRRVLRATALRQVDSETTACRPPLPSTRGSSSTLADILTCRRPSFPHPARCMPRTGALRGRSRWRSLPPR